MNTNTKYYTPTIEEFHVGFEFEFLNNQNEWIFSNDFSLDFADDDTDTVSEVERLLEVSKIRVKNLCREDIESENWELDSCVEKECFYIHKSSNLKNGTIRLVFREKEGSIEINCDKFGECFYGILKNKSELQKLMIQLNIKE